MAATIKADFYETSSKSNINVEEVFQNIAEKMYKRLMTKPGSSNIKKNEGGPKRELKEEQSTIGLKASHHDVMPQAQPSQKQSKIKLNTTSV